MIRVDSSSVHRPREEYPAMRKVKANLEFLVRRMKEIAEFKAFARSLDGRVEVIKRERHD